MSRNQKVEFVGAAFGSPQVTNIKTAARTAKGGPYNIKFKMIQRTITPLSKKFKFKKPEASAKYNLCRFRQGNESGKK